MAIDTTGFNFGNNSPSVPSAPSGSGGFNFSPGAVNVGDNSGLGGTLASLYDLWRGVTGKDTSQSMAAARLADPFMDQRQQYQAQLQQLMTDPSSFKTDPGYEFAVQQGQDAIMRSSNAANGTTRVGSLPIDLAKYTEGYAEQAYDTRLGQLATLSGATTGSPGAAGAILQRGQQANNASQASGIGAVGALLAQALGLTGTGAQQLIQMLQKAMGGGSTGTSGVDNSGDFTFPGGDFTTDPGFSGDIGSPFGIDQGTAGNIGGVINDPTGAVGGGVNGGLPWVTNPADTNFFTGGFDFGSLFGGG